MPAAKAFFYLLVTPFLLPLFIHSYALTTMITLQKKVCGEKPYLSVENTDFLTEKEIQLMLFFLRQISKRSQFHSNLNSSVSKAVQM